MKISHFKIPPSTKKSAVGELLHYELLRLKVIDVLENVSQIIDDRGEGRLRIVPFYSDVYFDEKWHSYSLEESPVRKEKKRKLILRLIENDFFEMGVKIELIIKKIIMTKTENLPFVLKSEDCRIERSILALMIGLDIAEGGVNVWC